MALATGSRISANRIGGFAAARLGLRHPAGKRRIFEALTLGERRHRQPTRRYSAINCSRRSVGITRRPRAPRRSPMSTNSAVIAPIPALYLQIHSLPTGSPTGRLPLADAIENWNGRHYGGNRAFPKIMKPEFKVETSRLRTAPRLMNLTATCCAVAWRIFWLTMINRNQPATTPTVALTHLESQIFDRLAPDRCLPAKPRTLSHYIVKIALYLARLHRPHRRSGPGQHCHVARPRAPHRHRHRLLASH